MEPNTDLKAAIQEAWVALTVGPNAPADEVAGALKIADAIADHPAVMRWCAAHQALLAQPVVEVPKPAPTMKKVAPPAAE